MTLRVRAFIVEDALAAKLGSIVVHVQEAIGPESHTFDVKALDSLVRDPEVEAFITELGDLALVPVKR